MSLKTVLLSSAPYLSRVLEPVLGGALHKYGQVATTAVRSAITKTDNGLEELVAVYRRYDASHPLVQTAIAEAQSLIQLAGLEAPDAEGLATHIRAAIHDLASAFVPLDGTKAASETSSQTVPSALGQPVA
ncbi:MULTISPECIES: hypothetical protein [unclassified Saccharibacter]|uniref:hypothetical protein n=1 Tax=unclassified Saccharibacter TaxID=2648722 RepID=UPI001323E4B7|nr:MULTISPECIES: hypothetical protein [unclassified Saccharibacter]MXV35822.1 hypothetical protein [Saccharibacter sp. EH611]MXV57943.1 hypothetical protein [Saccharibacter sp. EH70]MXV66338.1 hypothetical protein [Saccharibacter sp. EH60]